MNEIKNQTLTISSQNLTNFENETQLSWFIGYSVNTKTISTGSLTDKSISRDFIKNSLERSIKENSGIWEELSKH
jgi:hypothetical protein